MTRPNLRTLSNHPIALTIAGSDSSGGAGVQADLRVFTQLGVYGCTAITAVTSQNTHEVSHNFVIPALEVRRQVQTVLADLKVQAVKVGMLGSAENVEVVAELLDGLQHLTPIIDPIFSASTSAPLLTEAGIRCFRKLLIPRAGLLTPNIVEAAILLGCQPADVEREIERSCLQLVELGAKAVLLKGGHTSSDDAEDVLYDGEFSRFSVRRINTQNLHGSGCTFSAAITAFIAGGEPLQSAVAKAKVAVTEAIREADALGVGAGRGPLNHFAIRQPG